MLKTFYDFLIRHLKNVKSHVFWKSEKKHKIRILEHCSEVELRLQFAGFIGNLTRP